MVEKKNPIPQTGAIPFLRIKDQLKIMIITARRSDGTFWITPKGKLEPDMTPAETAQMEALEEAGIKGCVAEKPIGSYTYEKNDEKYRVDVFPLEITRILKPEEWLESEERQCCLVAVDKATALLSNRELAKLIKHYEKCFDN